MCLCQLNEQCIYVSIYVQNSSTYTQYSGHTALRLCTCRGKSLNSREWTFFETSFWMHPSSPRHSFQPALMERTVSCPSLSLPSPPITHSLLSLVIPLPITVPFVPSSITPFNPLSLPIFLPQTLHRAGAPPTWASGLPVAVLYPPHSPHLSQAHQT